MSNSSLVSYTRISPNSSNPRTNSIKKITIHHMAGNLTIEQCGNTFSDPARQASSNYGVGTDGRIGMYVEEKNRSWASSSPENDHQAITLEVANDGGEETDWHVSDKALAATIDLCVDICKRNGIPYLNFTGDASGNFTQHNFFKNTACPGPYLKSKYQYIADCVNARLDGSAPPSSSTPPSDSSSTTKAALPTLKKGSKGSEVKKLQQFLKGISTDGDFGGITDDQVRDWQRRSKLSVDGIYGSNSQKECQKQLDGKVTLPAQVIPTPTLKKGSTGQEVKELQTILRVKVDGDFGPNTDNALRSWQSLYSLKSDGIYGSQSQSKMKSVY